ncbi:VOC family protein [Williamsia soli]|uniref:VOC family protein n=1 Tax=Williamsia soli TaxID=364929 RepID=UPI001A9FFAD2|nr:VOC family protein [Williamsia soli]
MASPSKLAHIVLKTNQLDILQNWYVQVLDARIAYASDVMSFISYDDEHHRVAFVSTGATERPTDSHSGLHHVAFTYHNLDGLLDTYFRLKELDINPVGSINHGPTTSMYYQDPDGNNVELQVDNFATAEAAQEYIDANFDTNPIGVPIDPEEIARRYRAGESFEELVRL